MYDLTLSGTTENEIEFHQRRVLLMNEGDRGHSQARPWLGGPGSRASSDTEQDAHMWPAGGPTSFQLHRDWLDTLALAMKLKRPWDRAASNEVRRIQIRPVSSQVCEQMYPRMKTG